MKANHASRLILASFAAYGLTSGVWHVALPDLQRALGLSPGGLEAALSVGFVAAPPMMVAGGRLADRWGARTLILLAALCVTAGLLGFGVVRAYWQFVALLVVLGVPAPAEQHARHNRLIRRDLSMRILVSNDDGIYSPGILALAEVAGQFGSVTVVAPDVEQSAMGQAITIQRPLRYHRTPLADFEAYRVNGTPADCVGLGLCQWDKADLVVSGINLGSNIGHEIWYSGTVAAARQAALVGVPAVAFSLVLGEGEPDFAPLVPYAEQVLKLVLQTTPAPPLVNVNFPPQPQGVRWTRQSVRRHTNRVVEGHDPDGRPYYWVTDDPLTDPAENTDRWAVQHGFVSVTPLHLDLTDEMWLAKIQGASQPADGG